MPAFRRVSGQTAAHDAATSAAVNVPPRRRGKGQAGMQALLTTFEAAPLHLKDNKFILRGYRTGYTIKSSFLSLFNIHNETGNVWSHLVGFMIFALLTFTTIQLRPAPLRLGAEALVQLEQRLYDFGQTNLYELVTSAESWERNARRYGADTLAAVEDRLRSIGLHNMQELTEMTGAASAVASQVRESVGGRARGMGAWLRRHSRSGMAELALMEDKIAAYGSEAVRDVEAAVHRALALVLDARWPVSRWPIYVFTGGAMLCLLTSSVCHLFGCCSAHVTAVMWRFDYAGIAVLIVASFYPPVYYSFMCNPGMKLFYLISTTLLGLSTLGVTLLDRFQEPEWHFARAGLFCGLGIWGVVPLIHSSWLNGGVPEVISAIRLDFLMGAIYLLGAALYATRVPERWKPGAFDVAFHSHQLFHVAVVVAAVIHYKASSVLLHWRDATGGCGAY